MCNCTTIKVLFYFIDIFDDNVVTLRHVLWNKLKAFLFLFFKTPIFKNGEYEVNHDYVILTMTLQDNLLLLSQAGVYSEMATN